MKRQYLLWLVAGLILAGCSGGEEGSSKVSIGGGAPVVVVPIPANPTEPGETEEEPGEEGSAKQITSADGSTPPPPPTIVR